MHRLGTDRNITPTTQQMSGNSPSIRTEDVVSEKEDAGGFTTGGYAASTDSLEISQGANGIGPRWDTFQNRLRERRKEVISTGSTDESAQGYRKAS